MFADSQVQLRESPSCLSKKLSHYRQVPADEEPILAKTLRQNQRSTQSRAILIEQGEPAAEICVILKGWASRQKIVSDGSRQILAFHLPGDICEFNALLGASSDTQTVALSDVRSARITRRALNELAATAPKVSQALWWEALSSNAIQREWLINIARRGASERIAHLLCELHYRLSLVGAASDTAFASPLTQAQLGNACGMSAEHTNRTLRKLRDTVGIGLEDGEVRFADIDAAHRYSDFDRRYVLLNGL